MGNTRFWVPVDPKPFDRSTWNLTWVITSAVRPHTLKIVKIGLAGRPRHRGEISCSNIFFTFFYIFFWLLAHLWRARFLQYSHHFCVKRRVSVGIDFLGGSNFDTKIFPHLNPKNLNFMDLENFRPKRSIMGRLISKLPLIITAAPWKLQSE